MGIKFGTYDALTSYESSLVFSMDPANTSCFAGPPTTNELGTGMSIYNNVSANVTATLVLDSPRRFFRGAPVYKHTLTPTNSTGVGNLTGGSNPGIGVVTGGGGGPANTYTGHSIFFKPTFPLHSSPIYTHYSNIGGWQSTTTREYIGDGWYRAFTTWYDTTTRNDGKYWAINPKNAELNKPLVVYWAGPFKETRPQNALGDPDIIGARSVNPYTRTTRSATYGETGGLNNPWDSVYNHGGVSDLSGRGNGMNVNGTIWYDPSDGGGSMAFNGDAWLISRTNCIESSADYFTLEAWAKTSTGSGWQTVIGTENTLRQIGFLNTNFYAGGNGGGGNQFLNGGSVLIDVWYHLVMTFDGLNAKLYKDGIEVNSGYIGFLSGGAVPGRSMIGSYSTGGNELLNGKVGLARIYNRELSAAEVLQNYNATKSRYGK